MRVKMPLGFVAFGGKPVTVIPVFDVFIDLPSNQKGIHASRNYEVIPETLRKYAGKMFKLEDVCGRVARELLRQHRYAVKSEVKGVGEAVLERPTLDGEAVSYESYKIMGAAIATRGEGGRIAVRRKLGVGVIGITACPCTQEILKTESLRSLEEKLHLSSKMAKDILNQIPIATHTQRAYGSIVMEIPEGGSVEAALLAKIIEGSMSASTIGLLKRSEEAELVRRATGNPRFVEDCLRRMMAGFARGFEALPDSSKVVFSLISKESIHKHDLAAKTTTTLGEIRKELGLS